MQRTRACPQGSHLIAARTYGIFVGLFMGLVLFCDHNYRHLDLHHSCIILAFGLLALWRMYPSSPALASRAKVNHLITRTCPQGSNLIAARTYSIYVGLFMGLVLFCDHNYRHLDLHHSCIILVFGLLALWRMYPSSSTLASCAKVDQPIVSDTTCTTEATSDMQDAVTSIDAASTTCCPTSTSLTVSVLVSTATAPEDALAPWPESALPSPSDPPPPYAIGVLSTLVVMLTYVKCYSSYSSSPFNMTGDSIVQAIIGMTFVLCGYWACKDVLTSSALSGSSTTAMEALNAPPSSISSLDSESSLKAMADCVKPRSGQDESSERNKTNDSLSVTAGSTSSHDNYILSLRAESKLTTQMRMEMSLEPLLSEFSLGTVLDSTIEITPTEHGEMNKDNEDNERGAQKGNELDADNRDYLSHYLSEPQIEGTGQVHEGWMNEMDEAIFLSLSKKQEVQESKEKSQEQPGRFMEPSIDRAGSTIHDIQSFNYPNNFDVASPLSSLDLHDPTEKPLPRLISSVSFDSFLPFFAAAAANTTIPSPAPTQIEELATGINAFVEEYDSYCPKEVYRTVDNQGRKEVITVKNTRRLTNRASALQEDSTLSDETEGVISRRPLSCEGRPQSLVSITPSRISHMNLFTISFFVLPAMIRRPLFLFAPCLQNGVSGQAKRDGQRPKHGTEWEDNVTAEYDIIQQVEWMDMSKVKTAITTAITKPSSSMSGWMQQPTSLTKVERRMRHKRGQSESLIRPPASPRRAFFSLQSDTLQSIFQFYQRRKSAATRATSKVREVVQHGNEGNDDGEEEEMAEISFVVRTNMLPTVRVGLYGTGQQRLWTSTGSITLEPVEAP
ncbi:hypothetical protein BG004_005662, partial [Podila humilis]